MLYSVTSKVLSPLRQSDSQNGKEKTQDKQCLSIASYSTLRHINPLVLLSRKKNYQVFIKHLILRSFIRSDFLKIRLTSKTHFMERVVRLRRARHKCLWKYYMHRWIDLSRRSMLPYLDLATVDSRCNSECWSEWVNFLHWTFWNWDKLNP